MQSEWGLSVFSYIIFYDMDYGFIISSYNSYHLVLSYVVNHIYILVKNLLFFTKVLSGTLFLRENRVFFFFTF